MPAIMEVFNWDLIHPLVIHFPIVVAILAPIATVSGLLIPRHRAAFFWTVAFLLAVGSLTAASAVSSGQAAAAGVRLKLEADADLGFVDSPRVLQFLDYHGQVARRVALFFRLSTLLWLAFLVVGNHPRVKDWVPQTVPIIFLVGFAWLAFTSVRLYALGHYMVHTLGLHSQ